MTPTNDMQPGNLENAVPEPGKTGEPDEELKAYPLPVPLVLLSDLPPARSHVDCLIAVRNDSGFTTVLAYSDGENWLKIHFDGPIADFDEDDPAVATDVSMPKAL